MPASELDLINNFGWLGKILRQISTDVFYQVIEKDAETDRKKAVIEAEKEAQVAKIRLAHTFCVCICCILVFVSCICLRIFKHRYRLG